ncbi:MAG: hypothetical protein EZS28_047426, partial [Streblomastix strix]
MITQMTSSNRLEYFESIEVKPIASNVKYETLEKGPTCNNITNLASLREILDKWNVDIEMPYM